MASKRRRVDDDETNESKDGWYNLKEKLTRSLCFHAECTSRGFEIEKDLPFPEDPKALCRLGYCYAYGQGGAKKDSIKAMTFWEKAAALGNTDAEESLAFYYWSNNSKDKALKYAERFIATEVREGIAFLLCRINPAQYSLQKVLKLCDYRIYSACVQLDLSRIYRDGTAGNSVDTSEAARWMLAAANGGCVWAMFYMSSMERDAGAISASVEWLMRAADRGLAAAQLRLGLWYEDGTWLPRSQPLAIEWIRKSALQQYARAQGALGYRYLMGNGVTRDETVALEWLHLGANQNDAVSQYYLYLAFKKTDSAQSTEWLKKSAAGGDEDAQYALAERYYHGKDGKEDMTEAKKWYTLAAEQDHALSAFALGYMHENGEGCGIDYTSALQHYRKASRLGAAAANYALSRLYRNGLGIDPNPHVAIMYCLKAAVAGHRDAQKDIFTFVTALHNKFKILKDVKASIDWIL